MNFSPVGWRAVNSWSNSETAQADQLNRLPIEITKMIISYLGWGNRNAFSLKLVSRRFYSLTQQTHFLAALSTCFRRLANITNFHTELTIDLSSIPLKASQEITATDLTKIQKADPEQVGFQRFLLLNHQLELDKNENLSKLIEKLMLNCPWNVFLTREEAQDPKIKWLAENQTKAIRLFHFSLEIEKSLIDDIVWDLVSPVARFTNENSEKQEMSSFALSKFNDINSHYGNPKFAEFLIHLVGLKKLNSRSDEQETVDIHK